MAIFYLDVQKISRAAKRSAVAAAAYRSGERLADERAERVYDYTRRAGVVHSELIGWTGDRAGLWNAAERAEKRKDSVTARELVYSLAPELSTAGRVAVAHQLAQEVRAMTGAAVDLNVHAPSTRKGSDHRNHHVHIQWTARAVDDAGQFAATKVDPFSLKGGPELVTALRARAAAITNAQLSRELRPERVDHRSYAEQDAALPVELQRVAAEPLQPQEVALERRGLLTEAADRKHAVAAYNASRPERMVAAANAQIEAWEAGLDAWRRLPPPSPAPSAAVVAEEVARLDAAYDRIYVDPAAAAAAIAAVAERKGEGPALDLLGDQPEWYGALREVNAGQAWGSPYFVSDRGQGARGVAAVAVHRWRQAVAEPEAAAAAAEAERARVAEAVITAAETATTIGAALAPLHPELAPQLAELGRRAEAAIADVHAPMHASWDAAQVALQVPAQAPALARPTAPAPAQERPQERAPGARRGGRDEGQEPPQQRRGGRGR